MMKPTLATGAVALSYRRPRYESAAAPKPRRQRPGDGHADPDAVPTMVQLASGVCSASPNQRYGNEAPAGNWSSTSTSSGSLALRGNGGLTGIATVAPSGAPAGEAGSVNVCCTAIARASTP